MAARIQARMETLADATLSIGKLKHIRIRHSQVIISLTSQSKLGYEKYNIRNEGKANKTVTRMYKARMAALAGIADRTMRRNMTTKGNLAVKWTEKQRLA